MTAHAPCLCCCTEIPQPGMSPQFTPQAKDKDGVKRHRNSRDHTH